MLIDRAETKNINLHQFNHTIMGIDKQWPTTLAFRNFREKTHDLSRVYWTQQMGADSLADQLNDKNAEDISAQVINSSFDFKMHFQKVSETLAWLPTYMERNRLHLLVIYTAFLETYLKEITFYHTASIGHISNINDIANPLKLTAVGAAMAQPIIRSSTVPDMIKYASEYYNIDFGVAAREWIKIYKVRCAAAHNGGIATPKFLKEISGQPLALRPQEYENIGLTWDELRTAMRHGDDIAAMIDFKVSSYEIKICETEDTLRELKAKKKLPPQKGLWELLYNEYRLFPIKRENKLNFLSKFY